MKTKSKDLRLSKQGLAAALGCSRNTVHKHLSKPEAPKPDRDGLYSFHEVRKFIEGRRSLNNDGAAGGYGGEILKGRAQKLSLEVESLRRDLALTGKLISLDELKTWLSRFMSQVQVAFPSGNRPELILRIMRVPGVDCDRVALCQCLQDWGNSCRNYLGAWCREHGVDVAIGAERVTVTVPDILTLASGSETIPENMSRDEVREMIHMLMSTLRAAGVTDDVFRQASAIASQREEGSAT